MELTLRAVTFHKFTILVHTECGLVFETKINFGRLSTWTLIARGRAFIFDSRDHEIYHLPWIVIMTIFGNID